MQRPIRYTLLLILSTTWLHTFAFGQDLSARLRQDAIPLIRPDSPGNEALRLLADYRLIMIGEMHGTREPAQLVVGLAELLARTDTVMVGFELPAGKMTRFLGHPKPDNVYASDFFVRSGDDGRACDAWAAAIGRLSSNGRVRLLFFDVNSGECDDPEQADSLMYLKVKQQLRAHPGWKMITLSGNVHNMLIPYKGRQKMGGYLLYDQELRLNGKICSLDHRYGGGTMRNDTGTGVIVRRVDNAGSVYATAVPFDQYLFLFRPEETNRYTGIFFTRLVIASGPARR